MEIKEITQKNEWEAFVRAAAPRTFLHSWSWGEFHRAQHQTIVRFGIYDGMTLVAVALLIKVMARRGTFLLCPHGPIISLSHAGSPLVGEIIKKLTEHLKPFALKLGCDFVRICPLLIDSLDNRATFMRTGYRQAPIHMHPELTWMLDITPSLDELMAGMRKTTRYGIRKAEKDGVTVEMSEKPEDVERFYKVYQDTVDRQHFTPFSRNYLRCEFETFITDKKVSWFFAVYKGETISAAMIIFSGNSGFYHHGASIQRYAKIPASYLLQWTAIGEAKRRGCALYNFYGVSPEDKPNHPWAGLSLFKKGFGGFPEAYVPAQDLPLTKKYWLNFVIEKVRKIRRRL
ncbi:MAG: peptidoglycan bridge formation glycyltransferase FemA/FemB family protein [bacterium]|nr:peptidoglycan bridge formation glycyltransferase FemA/FemB family protein [bacterium]